MNKRQLSRNILQSLVLAPSIAASSLVFSANAQSGVNVVDFLNAVGKVCGGTVSRNIESDNNNMSLKDTEITIDPGTGKLSVEREGALIAELDGEQSDKYYKCVENLTNSLGGQFKNSRDQLNPENDNNAGQEPTQAEMREAHESLVNPAALISFPIDHFEKRECLKVGNRRYRCTYSIRAGGFGPIKVVTNSFFKSGGRWMMEGG